MIASLIRTIFSQPDTEYVHTQHTEVVRMLERIHPKTAELLADSKEDLLAFTNFPRAHWRQIWSTNPLERLNREIKRRTDVVGVFPNPEALLRLTTMVLIEQHDEWAATNRRYLAEGSLKSLTHPCELDKGVLDSSNRRNTNWRWCCGGEIPVHEITTGSDTDQVPFPGFPSMQPRQAQVRHYLGNKFVIDRQAPLNA
jgi:hypothetical protein